MSILGMAHVRTENIPQELKDLRQWLGWKSEFAPDGKKPRKYPVSPYGGPGKSNDPSTWGTFQEACRKAKSEDWAGIGFVFTEADPYSGIDLDHCLDPVTGQWSNLNAAALVKSYGTYCETSPSGTGVHMICRVRPGLKLSCKDFPFGLQGGEPANVEVYAHGRFFCFTGKVRGDFGQVLECSPHHEELLTRFGCMDLGGHAAAVVASVKLDEGSLAYETGLMRAALARLDSDPEGTWFATGCSLKAWGHRIGRDDIAASLWHSWSQGSPKYTQQAAERMWGRVTATGRGPGSIFREARDNGWDDVAIDASGTKLDKPADTMTNWGCDDAISILKGERTIEPAPKGKRGSRKGFSPEARRDHVPIPESDRWLIHGVIPRQGFTLLVADPKSGKSMLGMELAISVSHGTPWMGMFQPRVQGRVLYMALEQGKQLTWDRMDQLGMEPMNDVIEVQEPSVLTTVATGREATMEYLKAQKEDGNPIAAVIIDPWQLYAASGESRLDAYKAEYKTLAIIKGMAEESGVTFILIHHTNKHGDINGSMAFKAAADATLLFTHVPIPRKPQANGWRMFKRLQADVTSRWGGVDEFGLEMWGQDMGDSAVQGRSLIQANISPFLKTESLKEAILFSLQGCVVEADALTITDMVQLVEDIGRHDSGGSVKKSLHDLVRNGLVYKASKGGFYLTHLGEDHAGHVMPPEWCQKAVMVQVEKQAGYYPQKKHPGQDQEQQVQVESLEDGYKEKTKIGFSLSNPSMAEGYDVKSCGTGLIGDESHYRPVPQLIGGVGHVKLNVDKGFMSILVEGSKKNDSLYVPCAQFDPKIDLYQPGNRPVPGGQKDAPKDLLVFKNKEQNGPVPLVPGTGQKTDLGTGLFGGSSGLPGTDLSRGPKKTSEPGNITGWDGTPQKFHGMTAQDDEEWSHGMMGLPLTEQGRGAEEKAMTGGTAGEAI